MARLPVPGGDNNIWGEVLNDFLKVEHNADGTLKASASLAGKADATRQINTGTGLTGGGDLTSNRILSVLNDTTTQRLRIGKNGSLVGTRPELNIIEGSNVTLAAVDDSVNNRVNVTINATPSATENNILWVNAAQAPYSADKTGAVDARAPIQTAINAVSAAGGGVVYLPPGVYLIGYTSNAADGAAGGLQLQSNVWLLGDGPATRLEATGAWSTEAGLVGIGDLTVTRNVHNAHVSHLWLKGSPGVSFAGSPPANIDGMIFNSGNVTWDSDAVHRVHDMLLWDFDRGIVIYGVDDQATNWVSIRGRHFLRQGVVAGKEDGTGGSPDNYFAFLDFSSANRQASGTYAGYEIYSTNNTWFSCGSWFNRRSTAFANNKDYKDGAGWFIKGTRNRFIGCQAQDNGGHGFLMYYGKNTFESCIADSNNYMDNVSGSALSNECSGFYISDFASDFTTTGLMAFNRNTTAQQKYGYYIDSAARNVCVKGIAYDNRATSISTDANDGVAWSAGAHSTHIVEVLSAYGSTRVTIANGIGSSASNFVRKRQNSSTTTVTGTTLTSNTQLSIGVPGGTKWYRIEGLIMYRADATTNGRIALQATSSSGGTIEINWQPTFTRPDGTVSSEYVLSLVGTTRYVVVDGDGGTAGAGYANQRALKFEGIMFAGSSVGTATITVQVCEDGGTGAGIRVVENSFISTELLTFS